MTGAIIGSFFDPVVGTAIGGAIGAWIGGQMQTEDSQDIFKKYDKARTKLISELELFLKKVYAKLTSYIAELTSLKFLTYEVIEQLIELFNKGKDYLEDKATLQKCIDLCNQATVINSGRYPIWCTKGIALYKLGRNEEAIASYDKALQLNPENEGVWEMRGDALANLARNEEAIAANG